eukprot:scaffold36192_cov60-Phaeocystis_antarctica.AAC.2
MAPVRPTERAAAWSKCHLLRLLRARLTARVGSTHSQGVAGSLAAQPDPRVPELGTSKRLKTISPPLTIQALARSLVESEGHAYLDTYQQTALRPGGHHRSRHDCVHWCLPGPPNPPCSPLTLTLTLTLFLTLTLTRCLPGPPDEWTRLLLLLWLHGAGSGTSTLRDGSNTHGGTPYALGVHD